MNTRVIHITPGTWLGRALAIAIALALALLLIFFFTLFAIAAVAVVAVLVVRALWLSRKAARKAAAEVIDVEYEVVRNVESSQGSNHGQLLRSRQKRP